MNSLTIELRDDQTQTSAGMPYLSLQLEPNVTVAIQMQNVRETLVLPASRFTQMPNVHHCLKGLVEHRSNVFWTVDLPQLLGFTPLQSNATETHLVILQVRDAFLGLGVYRIGQVLRFADSDLCSPIKLANKSTPMEMMQFLKGWASPPDSSENLYVLDVEAIAFNQYKT